MLSREALEEIKQRCARATPGPWERKAGTPPAVITTHDHKSKTFPDTRRQRDENGKLIGLLQGVCVAVAPNWEERWRDMDFLAHARTDVPALLKHIEELEQQLQTLKANAAPTR
jgi:hypothetical protein